jgi:hypothetical protein
MAEKFSLKIFLNDERIRTKGIIRFIFEIGIIRFALPFAVLTEIIIYVFSNGLTSPNIEELLTGRKIFYFILNMCIEGVTVGLIIWFWGKQEDYPKLNP